VPGVRITPGAPLLFKYFAAYWNRSAVARDGRDHSVAS
jgi:hypothetical protein